MQLGYFWPAQLYKKKFQRDIPKADIKWHMHNNTWHKGTYLGPEHGWEIGCIKVTQASSIGGTKSTCVADSSDAPRPEIVGEAWQAVNERAAIKVGASKKPGGDGELGSVTLRPSAAAGNADDPSFFDDLWETPFSKPQKTANPNKRQRGAAGSSEFGASSAEGDDGASIAASLPTSRNSRRPSGGSRGGRGRASTGDNNVPPGGAPAPTAHSDRSAVQHLKDLQASEAVLQQCRSVHEQLQDSNSAMAVTQKSVEALLSKVTGWGV
eukprot:1707383-Alexandrium_andersonii.AAC.1